MTTKQQEISESKETEKIVIREIKPILPREIWEIIFYLIQIRDKLTCSKLIIEFRDFYQELFTNYEKYVDSFRDFKVEKAWQYGDALPAIVKNISTKTVEKSGDDQHTSTSTLFQTLWIWSRPMETIIRSVRLDFVVNSTRRLWTIV